MDPKLKKFLAALEVFRNIDNEIPSQLIAIFLMIADKPGIRTSDLIPLSRMSKATVARHVALLSHYGITGKKGLGFIRMEEYLPDRRVKLLYLTPQGEGFLRTVAKALE